MLVVREMADQSATSGGQDTLLLPYDRRQHSRQRACLEGGEHIALMLPRGTMLRDGDLLRCEGGRLVQVRAAPECVSRVMSKNVLQLTRAAYHLGNRHIPTQLGAGYLAYLHDHVIDDMIRRLGLEVTVVNAPFEPEAGAYGHGAIHSHHGGAHSHSHDDAPTHDHPGAATA